MPQIDSIDKIVTSYFTAITTQPFTYKDVSYLPKPLFVSPLLFRGFTCPAHCGGCCPRFSLDYLPMDADNNVVTVEREVSFNGRMISIWSDMQDDHRNHHCRNLQADGRCGIHGSHPFSCDFELIRCLHFDDKNVLTQKLFGRGWAFLRVDRKERGALCAMTDPDAHTIREVVRKLKALDLWARHFSLDTHIPAILRWIDAGYYAEGLWVGQAKRRGFFSYMGAQGQSEDAH